MDKSGKKETDAIRKKAGETKNDVLAKLITELTGASSRYYGQTHQQWERNYSYWVNHPLNRQRFEKGAQVDIPLAWMVVDGVLGSMTDGRPRPVFTPDERMDIAKANVVGRLMQGPIWELLKLDQKMEMAIKIALAISGAVVSRDGLDSEGNLFDVVYNPRDIFVEPNINEIDEMEWIFTQTPVSVGALKYGYGSKADHVKGEILDDNWRRLYGGKSFVVGADMRIPYLESEKLKTSGTLEAYEGNYGRAYLIHGWMKDYEVGEKPFSEDETLEELERAKQGQDSKVQGWENHVRHIRVHKKDILTLLGKWGFGETMDRTGLPVVPEQATIGNDEMERDWIALNLVFKHIQEHLMFPQTERGLRFPLGKEVWMCQNKILQVRPSVFGNPYHGFQLDQDPSGNFWGESLMEYLLPVQEQFNRLVSKTFVHADLVANGRMFYNARLGILWDKVKEKIPKGKVPVGMMIPTDGSPKDAVYWDYGGSMPSYVFTLLMAFEQWAYKLGGFTEVQQGQVPAYASGTAMNTALRGAGVRIRRGVKHLGWFYQRKFRLLIKYLAHADPMSIYRMIGDNNQDEIVAFSDIEWDAIDDVRVDVRNVLGSWREEQREHLMMIIERRPELAEIILPELQKMMDVNFDLEKLDREKQLEQALAVAHDQLTQMKEQIK